MFFFEIQCSVSWILRWKLRLICIIHDAWLKNLASDSNFRDFFMADRAIPYILLRVLVRVKKTRTRTRNPNCRSSKISTRTEPEPEVKSRTRTDPYTPHTCSPTCSRTMFVEYKLPFTVVKGTWKQEYVTQQTHTDRDVTNRAPKTETPHAYSWPLMLNLKPLMLFLCPSC